MTKFAGIGSAFFKSTAWVLDSDGNKIELWEPTPREEQNKTK
jgi:hypothetical protein